MVYSVGTADMTAGAVTAWVSHGPGPRGCLAADFPPRTNAGQTGRGGPAALSGPTRPIIPKGGAHAAPPFFSPSSRPRGETTCLRTIPAVNRKRRPPHQDRALQAALRACVSPAWPRAQRPHAYKPHRGPPVRTRVRPLSPAHDNGLLIFDRKSGKLHVYDREPRPYQHPRRHLGLRFGPRRNRQEQGARCRGGSIRWETVYENKEMDGGLGEETCTPSPSSGQSYARKGWVFISTEENAQAPQVASMSAAKDCELPRPYRSQRSLLDAACAITKQPAGGNACRPTNPSISLWKENHAVYLISSGRQHSLLFPIPLFFQLVGIFIFILSLWLWMDWWIPCLLARIRKQSSHGLAGRRPNSATAKLVPPSPWDGAAGKLFIFDMCQWHLDWKLGMPMGEPFFSWFTLEAIARSSVPNLIFVTAFQLLFLWRTEEKGIDQLDMNQTRMRYNAPILVSCDRRRPLTPDRARPHVKNPTTPPRATPRSATKPSRTRGPLPRGQYTLDAGAGLKKIDPNRSTADWGRMRVLSAAQQGKRHVWPKRIFHPRW